jgi:hypothetical protein
MSRNKIYRLKTNLHVGRKFTALYPSSVTIIAHIADPCHPIRIRSSHYKNIKQSNIKQIKSQTTIINRQTIVHIWIPCV